MVDIFGWRRLPFRGILISLSAFAESERLEAKVLQHYFLQALITSAFPGSPIWLGISQVPWRVPKPIKAVSRAHRRQSWIVALAGRLVPLRNQVRYSSWFRYSVSRSHQAGF